MNNGHSSVTPQLLEALLSAGPERGQAEALFQSIPITSRLPQLLQLASSSFMASVLIRRDLSLVARMVVYEKTLGESEGLALLNPQPVTQLFLALAGNTPLQKQIGYSLTELCESLQLISSSKGKEATTFVVQQMEPMIARSDPVALDCLASLCEQVDMSGICLSDLLHAASNHVSPANLEALLGATCAAAASLTQDTATIGEATVTQLGATVLVKLLSTNTSLSAKSLQDLAYAATSAPSLIAGDLTTLQRVFGACLASTNEPLAALETISSICSHPQVQHKILNRTENNICQQLLQANLFQLTLTQLVGYEDFDDDDGEGTFWDEQELPHAQVLLGTFLHSLGGARALPVVLPLAETLLKSHPRHAYQVLQQCLVHAPVSFAPHILTTLEAALIGASSSNHEVQYEALVLLGSLIETTSCQDVRVLQAACHCVSTFSSWKVSAMASVVIGSYCRSEHTENIDISPVLQALCAGPLQTVQSNNSGALRAQIKGMGAVACLAEASGSDFLPYYSTVMPGLLNICKTTNSSNPQVAQLRGAALESMTIVGQAIDDVNTYAPDATAIMQMATPLLGTDVISDQELLSACARIARVMGEQYAPYCEHVLPHLLQRVNEKVDLSFKDGTEDGLEASKRGDYQMDDDGILSMTLRVPGKGLTAVSVNTIKMEEKSHACRAIYEHAAALGASFGPFAATCLESLLPLVSFAYSAEVRSTSSLAVSAVFDAACQAGYPVAADYLPRLSDAIVKQIYCDEEAEMETVQALCEALSDTMYYAYRRLDEDASIVSKFSAKNGKELVNILMKLIGGCLQRRTKIVQTLHGADGALSGEDERKALTEALKAEEDVLTPLVDSVGYTLKFLKDQFLPIFDAYVAPVLGPFLKNNPDDRARFAALALFDDCVEHCGSAAASKYGPALAEGALAGLENDSDLLVKQVSLYGIAQIARYAPPNTLQPHAQNVIAALLPIARSPKDAFENSFIVEYAVSALASLTLIGQAPLGHLKFLNQQDLVRTFCSQLPLYEDEDEAKICHQGFADLLLQSKVSLVQSEILHILGETLAGEDLLKPETRHIFCQILSEMQQKSTSVQQDFGTLSMEARDAINETMQEYAQHASNVVSP